MSSLSLADIPVQAPPPGIVPNFVNPVTRAPIVVRVEAVCLALDWIAFSLRMYSRVKISRSWAWDDVTSSFTIVWRIFNSIGLREERTKLTQERIGRPHGLLRFHLLGFVFFSILASILEIPNCLIVDAEMTSVFGPHGWDVPAIKITPFFSSVSIVVTLIFSNFLFLFAKIFLFLLYLKLFSAKPWFRFACLFGIFATMLFYIAGFVAFSILCIVRPGETWLQVQAMPRCLQGEVPVTFVVGIFGLAPNIYIFVLPIPVIMGLHLGMNKKLGLVAIFASGLLAIAASSIGLYYRTVITGDEESIWNVPSALLVAVVEISTGILCGNMPYLRTLFHDRSKWPQSVEQPGNHSDISIHRQILTSFRGFLAHFTRGSSISRSTNGAMSEESNQALEHARYKSMPRSSERLWKPSAVEESSCA